MQYIFVALIASAIVVAMLSDFGTLSSLATPSGNNCGPGGAPATTCTGQSGAPTNTCPSTRLITLLSIPTPENILKMLTKKFPNISLRLL